MHDDDDLDTSIERQIRQMDPDLDDAEVQWFVEFIRADPKVQTAQDELLIANETARLSRERVDEALEDLHEILNDSRN